MGPENAAVTVRAAFIVTLQVVPLEVSQPPQLTNVDPASGEAASVTAVPAASDTPHVAPQLIPPPVTVPDPVPLFWTVRVYGPPPPWVLNAAVTVRAAFIVTLQVVPLEVSQPPQLTNVDPASGEAASVTAVPAASDTPHVAPQLIPPPVTVPDPVPLFWTVRVYGPPPPWVLNVAVTVRAAFTVTLQVVPLEVSQPPQLTNVDPASGEAVSVTAVPAASDTPHVAPQLIPPPVTVPDPVPLFWTVRV